MAVALWTSGYKIKTPEHFPPFEKRGHTYSYDADVFVEVVIPEMLLTLLPLVVLDFWLSVISVRADDAMLFFVGTTV